MVITFENKKLQDVLESEKKLRREYGRFANRVKQRLDELATYETLDALQREMPHIHCHELTGNMKGLLAVNLTGNYRLLFRPEEPVPRKPDGGLDWKQIQHIVIVGITDYH
jgi:proteic killer suppression protein